MHLRSVAQQDGFNCSITALFIQPLAVRSDGFTKVKLFSVLETSLESFVALVLQRSAHISVNCTLLR